jgi:hypothetical protein
MGIVELVRTPSRVRPRITTQKVMGQRDPGPVSMLTNGQGKQFNESERLPSSRSPSSAHDRRWLGSLNGCCLCCRPPLGKALSESESSHHFIPTGDERVPSGAAAGSQSRADLPPVAPRGLHAVEAGWGTALFRGKVNDHGEDDLERQPREDRGMLQQV